MTGDGAPLLLDAEQVAELLCVRVSWVREATRDGRLPSVRFPGSRLVRYREADLEAWVAECARPGREVRA